MKPLTEEHLAIYRRHMVDVIDIHFDLISDELGKSSVGERLRPQLGIEVGRQVNDERLNVFGRTRRDWSLQASASIYKRDWNIAGFAPSIKLTYSRTFSTIALYDQKRLRTEFGLAKAF